MKFLCFGSTVLFKEDGLEKLEGPSRGRFCQHTLHSHRTDIHWPGGGQLKFKRSILRVVDLALNQAAKAWFHQYLDPAFLYYLWLCSFPNMFFGDKSATLILNCQNSSSKIVLIEAPKLFWKTDRLNKLTFTEPSLKETNIFPLNRSQFLKMMFLFPTCRMSDRFVNG